MRHKFPRRSYAGRPNPTREQYEVLRSAAAKLLSESEWWVEFLLTCGDLEGDRADRAEAMEEAAHRLRSILGRGADLV